VPPRPRRRERRVLAPPEVPQRELPVALPQRPKSLSTPSRNQFRFSFGRFLPSCGPPAAARSRGNVRGTGGADGAGRRVGRQGLWKPPRLRKTLARFPQPLGKRSAFPTAPTGPAAGREDWECYPCPRSEALSMSRPLSGCPPARCVLVGRLGGGCGHERSQPPPQECVTAGTPGAAIRWLSGCRLRGCVAVARSGGDGRLPVIGGLPPATAGPGRRRRAWDGCRTTARGGAFPRKRLGRRRRPCGGCRAAARGRVPAETSEAPTASPSPAAGAPPVNGRQLPPHRWQRTSPRSPNSAMPRSISASTPPCGSR
jgi:hypothetical protein